MLRRSLTPVVVTLIFLHSSSLLTPTEGKSSIVKAKNAVSSSSSSSSSSSPNGESNVFVRFAKSLAVEAMNEFKDSYSRHSRNPRFGLNFNVSMPGGGNGSAFPSFDLGGNGTNPLAAIAGAAGIPITIKVGSLGLKGAVLGSLLGLKAFIVNIIIIVLWIAFLVTGIAYFVCNLGLVSCSNLGGGLGGGAGGILNSFGGGIGGGGGGYPAAGYPTSAPQYGAPSSSSSGLSNPLSFFSSRAGLEQAQPIYKAIDEGYKKYQ